MSDQTPQPQPNPRNKLIGRLILIVFGLMLLVYFVPLALAFILHGL